MWRTPTALVTGAAILVGILVLGFVILRPGSAPADTTTGIIQPGTSIPAGIANGRTLGSATATVTIDEWTDFQCPYCGMLVRLIEPRIVTEFVVPGTAKLVAHDLSFIGAGRTPDESTDAAVASRCAADQNRFWEYREYLFSNQHAENKGDFTRTRLLAMGASAGLDQTKLTTCLDDKTIRAAVAAETAQGEGMGISQTPTLLINGRMYTGDLTFDGIAAAIRAAAGTTASPSSLASPAPSGVSPSP